MRKLFLSMIALSLVYLLAGCGATQKSTKKDVRPDPAPVAQAPVKPKAPEVLRFGFPNDYKNWTHGVSKIILDKSSPLYGFQQVFVNDIALDAYKKGSGYKDGSILVIGFYEAIDNGDNIEQGDIIWYAAMKKDSKAVKSNGWIFDGFDGKTLKSKIDNPITGCYICHMGKSDRENVFTQFAGEITPPEAPLEAAEGRYTFPTDLRTWRHSNSKVILDKNSPLFGFQQIYVNNVGVEANRANGTYPDGSHITIGFYEPVKENESISQGDIIWYASMKKDSQNGTKTGGWVMDGFNGKSLNSTVDNPMVGCFICHSAQKSNDYVFSKYVP